MSSSAAERTVSPDDPVADLGRALSRMIRTVTRAKTLTLAYAGRAEYANITVLAALSEAGPMRASALAEAAFSDPSTISRQVANLVDLGYVQRRPDPEDGRACVLALTPAGEQALAASRRARDEYLARLTADWPEPDRRTLAALVDRLADELSRDLHERGHPHLRVAPHRAVRHHLEPS
jgi:DNA-binding MarR family transcriptional regulator